MTKVVVSLPSFSFLGFCVIFMFLLRSLCFPGSDIFPHVASAELYLAASSPFSLSHALRACLRLHSFRMKLKFHGISQLSILPQLEIF